MKAFEWVSPTSVADAVKALPPAAKADPDESPQAIAGGREGASEAAVHRFVSSAAR